MRFDAMKKHDRFYFRQAANHKFTFLSGFVTAVPFIVRTYSIRTLQSNIALKALTIAKLKVKITQLKLHFNCYKKHTLTHLSLVVMIV